MLRTPAGGGGSSSHDMLARAASMCYRATAYGIPVCGGTYHKGRFRRMNALGTTVSFKGSELVGSNALVITFGCCAEKNYGLSLETVDELRVLPICQVVKLLALNLDISRLSTHLCFFLVLIPAPPVNEEYIQQADAVAHHNGDLCRQVLGSIFGLEHLRPDDVANTIADEIHGRNSGLLGPSCHICRDKGENGDKGRWRSLSEIVADELAHTLAVIEACNQQHADNRKKHADRRDE